jgi:hypothetical protein
MNRFITALANSAALATQAEQKAELFFRPGLLI